MTTTRKLIALMTPREWQIQANKETAELVGSPEYYAKAAEAKRYGMLADAIEAAQAEIADLLDQRRALMQAPPAPSPSVGIEKQEPFTYYVPTTDKIRPFQSEGDIPLYAAGASPQPTSGDYALGYAEGFNDACKPKAQPSQAPKTCTWTLDDEESGTWASSCGELWSFIDGGPKENRVTYCHHCGNLAAINAKGEV